MTELYNVGAAVSHEEIKNSLKEWFETNCFDIGKNREICFKNITFKDDKVDFSQYRKYIVEKRSIYSKIYADIYLKEGSSSKLIASKVMIGKFPKLIDARKIFLLSGNEYSLANSLRPKSGLYIQKNSKQEYIIRGNLAKGRNFKIIFEPDTLKMLFHVGSSNIPIYAFNTVLGITEDDFRKIFGREITDANYANLTDANKQAALRRLYNRFYEFKHDVNSLSMDEIMERLKEYMEENVEIDPDVSEQIYSVRMQKITKDLMLKVYEKFMKTIKGEEETISDNDLTYYRLYPAQLLFTDRLEKLKPELENSLKYKIKRQSDIERVLTGFFTKPLVGLISTSTYSRLGDQYNPISILDTANVATFLGEGAVGDTHALTNSVRGVDNTYLGVLDPVASPQGQKVGANLQLVQQEVRVDKKGEIYLRLIDKKGKEIFMPLREVVKYRILMPGQDLKQKKYKVMFNKKIVESKDWDFRLKHDTASVVAKPNTMMPFMNSVQGNRAFMSARFFTQALPLKEREIPLVYPIDPTDKKSSYEKVRNTIGYMIPNKAPVDGVVKSISGGVITIKDNKGKLHKLEYFKQLPFSVNTGLNQKPLVKVGDKVKAGQIILRDDYSDKEGKGWITPGTNLRVAYTPYYGLNVEDGVVISESASKKLTSVHYYKFIEEYDEDNFIIDKKTFMSYFPNVYKKEQLDKIDDNGIIKTGETVKPGDPLILMIEKRGADPILEKLGKISNKILTKYKNVSVEYNKEYPGTVVEANKGKRYAYVVAKTEEPAGVGDKIVGLYGNKGVIAKVIPDEEILHDEKGNPIDVIYSSTTVVSRINPAQIVEATLGKIAEKRGKPYEIEFTKFPKGYKSYVDFVKDELKKYKLKDKEKVYDPIKKKHVKNPIFVGKAYFLKLLKADKELSARGISGRYNTLLQPAKGGKEGAKALGIGEFSAIVAHNARKNLSEFSRIKSEYNPDFWKKYELGIIDFPKDETQAFKKFKALITVAGAVPETKDNMLRLIPLTDEATKQKAGQRKIHDADIVQSKSMKPIINGLFDPTNTGGLDGELWASYDLADGLISPLVSDYVRLLLDMKKDEFDDWQAEHTAQEMKAELSKIDINKELTKLENKAKRSKLTNNEVKIYRFLTNLKENNIKLQDLVITKLPVIPPKYRPVMVLKTGDVQLDDINLFYRDVILADKAYRQVKDTPFRTEAKKNLIHNIHALVGLKETKNPQLKNKGSRNILQYLSGVGSPKNGFVHSKLLKKTQDLSGRARIIPNPYLDMDTIEVPYAIALKIWEPKIRKELLKQGYPNSEIEKMLHEKNNPVIRNVVKGLAKDEIVWTSRAPVLHRYGIIAAKPKIVDRNTIGLNLFAIQGLNADFDGDAMQVFAPITEQAKQEAKKYLLSNLIFADGGFSEIAVAPLTVEAILGLYQMSITDKARLQKDFKKIFGNKKVDYKLPLTKKNVKDMLLDIARKYPEDVPKIYLDLKLLGEDYATELGSTVGIKEIEPLRKETEKIYNKYITKLRTAKTPAERLKILAQYQKETIKLAPTQENDFVLMIRSGAKGKDNQLASMKTTPALIYDPMNVRDTVKPFKANFSDGMPFDEFWEYNKKTRVDLVNTFTSVALPGTLNKLLLSSVVDAVVKEKDCGTHNGVMMDSTDPDIYGRLLAEDTGKFKRNTIITPEIAKKLPRQVKVRSPLTCGVENGVCQYCYGTDGSYKFPEIGTHVGIRSTHTIAEKLTQSALDAKHGGRDITRDIRGLSGITALFSSDVSNKLITPVATSDDIVDNIYEQFKRFVIVMKSGEEYILPEGQKPIVKVGELVRKGQPLGDGIVPFTEVAKYRGIKAAREEFKKGFQKELETIGRKANEKHIDMVAKHVANYLELETPIKREGLVPGDIVLYNKAVELGKKYGIEVPIDKVIPGQQLAEEVPGSDLSVGVTLSEVDIQDFKKMGIKKIKVFPDSIRFKIDLNTVYTSGLKDPDEWLGNLAQKYISRNIQTAVAEGAKQNLDTTNPFVKWLMGKLFSENSIEF